jgi:hypothetical protein
VSRGYLVFTDWHQNRLTCPFLVLCVHFTTIATRKSPRCTSASAWKLKHRQRSPALAFSSSIPFSRSTKSRGRRRPNSTETQFLGARRSDAHPTVCRVLHLQPWSRRAGACGLKRSANLSETSHCVKPAAQPCEWHRSACPRLSGGETTYHDPPLMPTQPSGKWGPLTRSSS